MTHGVPYSVLDIQKVSRKEGITLHKTVIVKWSWRTLPFGPSFVPSTSIRPSQIYPSSKVLPYALQTRSPRPSNAAAESISYLHILLMWAPAYQITCKSGLQRSRILKPWWVRQSSTLHSSPDVLFLAVGHNMLLWITVWSRRRRRRRDHCRAVTLSQARRRSSLSHWKPTFTLSQQKACPTNPILCHFNKQIYARKIQEFNIFLKEDGQNCVNIPTWVI